MLDPNNCIDIRRFDDPKDTPSEEFKIGNISSDNYEVVLNVPGVPFPIGQDFTICYRWFFDQIRFVDPGQMKIYLKLYMNKSDDDGTDINIGIYSRVIPLLREKQKKILNIDLKDFQANLNWPYYKERNTTWYNNLMTES